MVGSYSDYALIHVVSSVWFCVINVEFFEHHKFLLGYIDMMPFLEFSSRCNDQYDYGVMMGDGGIGEKSRYSCETLLTGASFKRHVIRLKAPSPAPYEGGSFG